MNPIHQLRDVHPNERPSAEQTNIVIAATRREVTGPRVAVDGRGWHVTDPPAVQDYVVFVVNITSEHNGIWAKRQHTQAGGSTYIVPGTGSAEFFKMPSGHTRGHFVHFVIRQDPTEPYEIGGGFIDGQPASHDQFCIVKRDRLIYPHYRLRLMTAIPVDQLCRPCEIR